MTTMREYLEAIRDRHAGRGFPGGGNRKYCEWCSTPGNDGWPCPDHDDAVAALQILDESKKTFGKYEGRIVPDPEDAP